MKIKLKTNNQLLTTILFNFLHFLRGLRTREDDDGWERSPVMRVGKIDPVDIREGKWSFSSRRLEGPAMIENIETLAENLPREMQKMRASVEAGYSQSPCGFMKIVSIEKIIKERNAALLSMDERRIRKFMEKYNPGEDTSLNPMVFWAGVHKAITAVPELGMEVRLKSKAWLTERGMQSADDGDLNSTNETDEGPLGSGDSQPEKGNSQ